jgi:hypothetical protein
MRLGHGKRMAPGLTTFPGARADPFYNYSKLLDFL